MCVGNKTKIFSILVLLFGIATVPANAQLQVLVLSLEKATYENNEGFRFIGTADETYRDRVSVIIRDSDGSFVAVLEDPRTDIDGIFMTVPVIVEKVFTKTGHYTATAVTDQQRELDGVTINLEYDGTKLAQAKERVFMLVEIPDTEIDVGDSLSFHALLFDSFFDDVVYALSANAPINATIDPATGKVTWTAAEPYGGSTVAFDVIASSGDKESRESVKVTVNKIEQEPMQEQQIKEETQQTESDDLAESNETSAMESKTLEEPSGPKPFVLAPFVDPAKDPYYYVERYETEAKYKIWFDVTFPQYHSIYDAVGLSEPVLPRFVDPNLDPQHYVDRYHYEPNYREWFDTNYPEYSSIYDAVGLDVPVLVAFIDPDTDPQYYVDRYNTDQEFQEWFDKTYPSMTILDAVNLANATQQAPQPKIECGPDTKLVNGTCELVETPKTSKGGGCLIATAAFGSEMSQQVQLLREVRDNKVLSTSSGESFVDLFNQFYYSFSPHVADYQRESPVFKEAVKIGIAPMLYTLSILSVVDINSEQDMLGVGIGIILMNIGMYFVAPVIVSTKLYKKLTQHKTDI